MHLWYIAPDTPHVALTASPGSFPDRLAGLPAWGDFWSRRPLVDVIDQHGLPVRLEHYRSAFFPDVHHDAFRYEHLNPLTQKKVRTTLLVGSDAHVWRAWTEHLAANHATLVIEGIDTPIDPRALIRASADPTTTRATLRVHDDATLTHVSLRGADARAHSRPVLSEANPRGLHAVEPDPGTHTISMAFADDENEHIFSIELAGTIALGPRERRRLTIDDLLTMTADDATQ